MTIFVNNMSRKNMYIQKELKNKCDICDSLKKACWNGEFWQKHLVKTVFVYFQIWIEEGCSFFTIFDLLGKNKTTNKYYCNTWSKLSKTDCSVGMR